MKFTRVIADVYSRTCVRNDRHSRFNAIIIIIIARKRAAADVQSTLDYRALVNIVCKSDAECFLRLFARCKRSRLDRRLSRRRVGQVAVVRGHSVDRYYRIDIDAVIKS